MSGDVIRNVTVKVRVEQDPASLSTGARGGGSGAGGSRGKTPEEEAAAAKARADREAARAGREAARQKREQERQDQQASRAAERARRDQERADKAARKEAANAAREKAKAEKEAADKARDFANEQKAAVKEAASATFEGTMKAARGFVYLTASTNESMEANVKMIERFEGTVSTIEGGISMVSGLVKAYQTLRTTAIATATANTALAVSQTAVNATAKGGGAGAAGAAGSAAIGGLASAKGLGVMLFNVAKPFVATVGVLVAKLALLAVAVGAVYELFGYLTGAKTRIFSDLLGLKGDRAAAASAEARTAKMEKRRNTHLETIGSINENVGANLENDQKLLDAQRQTATAVNAISVARQKDLAIQTAMKPFEDERYKLLQERARVTDPLVIQHADIELDRIEQQSSAMRTQLQVAAEINATNDSRLQAAGRVRDAEQAVADEQAKVARAQKDGWDAPTAALDHAMERLKAEREEQKAADAEHLSALRGAEGAMIGQADAIAAQVRSTQDMIRLEKEKERSGAAKFGRMTAPAQGQLQRISQKIQSGENLTDAEARFLDQSGIGNEVSEKHFAEKGRKAGFGGLDSRLSGVDATLQKRLEQRQSDLQADQHRAGSITTSIRNELNSHSERMEGAVKGLGEAMLAVEKRLILRIEAEARRMKAGAK